MAKPIKYAEKALAVAANAAWQVFDTLNQINPNPGFTPKWSDKPLLKSYEKMKPKLEGLDKSEVEAVIHYYGSFK